MRLLRVLTVLLLAAEAIAATHGQPSGARRLDYTVVNEYPHDPDAFLQGLLWHKGFLYESTGLYGRSTLRQVDLASGKVLKSIRLSSNLFGEGLAYVGERLVQLTWTTKIGFVYDLNTFARLRQFAYDTEGWGITCDGKMLIMSDGSSSLTYLDPLTFSLARKLPVTMNGLPVKNLNELEFIEGTIWANVWQTDMIVCIDPATGRVNSYLDLKGILRNPTGGEDVLNGIAYDAQKKRIFVSGKLWPRLFEIRVRKQAVGDRQ